MPCPNRPFSAAALTLGDRLINPYPDSRSGEFDEGEVVGVVLFVARCDALEVFELAEEALDDVGVDLDSAVVEEALEVVSATQRVADRLGQLALAGEAPEFGLPPLEQLGDDRCSAPLARRPAGVG